MRAIDVIEHKRDGLALSREEIDFFVQGVTRGTIPDYQAAAWLMAVYLRGMTKEETIDLTLAIVRSGEQLDLSDVAPFVVDKHSTGGVGDKTTLIVAPLVAAAGLKVGKLSGRGLGFTGGTLDKLESIPGFRTNLSAQEFREQLRSLGLVVTGQSPELAPADGKLYALRDTTSTVGCLPLIASSIMSKKIAAGTNGIVLDVKVGHGTFMTSEQEAVDLASLLVDIGRGLGRQVRAVISDMDQPLGCAVGNALELKEALDTLSGRGPVDLRQLCSRVAAQMLLLSRTVANEAEALPWLESLLDDGQALAKFRAWIAAQGGDLAYVDDTTLLPTAEWTEELPSPRSGYIAAVHAREIGFTSMLLGGGRAQKGDRIDPAVGIVLRAKIGDLVEQGEPLLELHANDPDRLAEARQRLLAAYAWSEEPVSPPLLIHGIVG